MMIILYVCILRVIDLNILLVLLYLFTSTRTVTKRCFYIIICMCVKVPDRSSIRCHVKEWQKLMLILEFILFGDYNSILHGYIKNGKFMVIKA